MHDYSLFLAVFCLEIVQIFHSLHFSSIILVSPESLELRPADRSTDNGVECLSTDGTSQWTQSLSARPQGLLADRRQLLVFCGNTVQVLTPPAAENNAQSNT